MEAPGLPREKAAQRKGSVSVVCVCVGGPLGGREAEAGSERDVGFPVSVQENRKGES